MKTRLSPADLPITSSGHIYHLDLAPGELASSIILVGDPGRAKFIASEYLNDIRVDREHRGLRTYTGSFDGEEISIVTSGMGTPSLEIVLGEVYSLFAFDFDSREAQPVQQKIRCIRVGTSGSLQEDTELGALIVSRFAVGMELSAYFYPEPQRSQQELITETELRAELKKAFEGRRILGGFEPYLVSSSESLSDSLLKEARGSSFPVTEGLTVSNSGFFAPQGRMAPLAEVPLPNLDERFAEMKFEEMALRCQNMEMECSLLFWLGRSLGMEVATIATAVAHRPTNRFLGDPEPSIRACAEAALRCLSGEG